MKTVVHFAQDVLRMQDRIDFLEGEVMYLSEYRDKYLELLDSSTTHSQRMVNSILTLAMTPGVLAAVAGNSK